MSANTIRIVIASLITLGIGAGIYSLSSEQGRADFWEIIGGVVLLALTTGALLAFISLWLWAIP